MPPLKNDVHERFSWLIAEGDTMTDAYRKLRPDAESAHVLGHRLYHRADVKQRVAEIKTEVALRSVMTISRKREILRQMVEGTFPTKVTRTPNGRLMATFDRLSALITDAKMAGEFAPEKHELINVNDLKLVFKSKGRNTAIVDAEIIEQEIPAMPPLEGEQPVPEPDLTQYKDAPMDPDQPQLDTL